MTHCMFLLSVFVAWFFVVSDIVLHVLFLYDFVWLCLEMSVTLPDI